MASKGVVNLKIKPLSEVLDTGDVPHFDFGVGDLPKIETEALSVRQVH
jgi:hypothetical protein